MKSDDFFDSQRPDHLLGRRVDMAFLDGMHHFEYLFRDFINTEKYCKPSSLILLHDCIPTDSYVARRDPDDGSLAYMTPHKDWWAGDVWKIVQILQKYRPNLKILALDAPPTGLVVVTDLDPASDVLMSNYQQIIEEFAPIESNETNLGAYWRSLEIIDTRSSALAGVIEDLLKSTRFGG